MQIEDEPLREVIALLEKAVVQLRRCVDGDTASRVFVPGQGYWTRDMFEKIVDGTRHLPGVVTLFELTAENADSVGAARAVGYGEVIAYSGLSDIDQRNNHARLSRLARTIIGATSWPVENWQDHASNQMQYRMPPGIAVWWRELRAADQATPQ